MQTYRDTKIRRQTERYGLVMCEPILASMSESRQAIYLLNLYFWHSRRCCNLDGSVVTWGSDEGGGHSSEVLNHTD